MNFITTYNGNRGYITIVALLLMLFLSISTIAQQGVNYKALIKDNLGNVVSNQSITIQFTLLQGNSQVQVYQETHNITTNVNGLISVIIGTGSTSDVFSEVNWHQGELALNVQVDIGDGLVDLVTTEFQYVPFSYASEFAVRANNVTGLEKIVEGGNQGWRLVDMDPAYYGDIGDHAVDLSISGIANPPYGALGICSVAFGFHTRATNSYATAFGYVTLASERYATAFGRATVASGENATSMGNSTEASGVNSLATGYSTEASGNSSIAMGHNAVALVDYSTAIGYQTQATDNYALALGRNSLASGETSTAYGDSTVASGLTSTAFGYSTVASGVTSTAFGNQTEASGLNSIAFGRTTEASGSYSIAMGLNGIASGDHAIVVGEDVEATRENAIAMGYNTRARARYSTSIGYYNVGVQGASSGLLNLSEPLFEIGNGNSSTRSNALTVLRNGNVGIGTHTPDESLHITGGRLKIGTETIEDGGNNALRFNASLLPDNNNVMSLGNSTLRWTGLWATDGTINTSDRREKKNIRSLTYGLDEVLKMQPVSYQWKNRQDQDTKLGLIAQDVLKLVPEVVKTHEWQTVSDNDTAVLEKVQLDRLGVYYSDLIPVLIKAIQEQQEIISSQQQQNNLQKAELTELQKGYQMLLSRIETLESSTSN